MKKRIESVMLAMALSTAAVAYGATTPAVPADAPAGTTGLCKDGSYSAAAAKKGACKGHKGVKQWYAAPVASAPATEAKKPEAAPEKPVAAAEKPAAAPTKAAGAPAAPAASAASASAPAPGGGPGLVRVNSESKVYHCQGDRWYGKTKQGQYLPEADAKAKGNRPEHGKACS